MARNLLIIRGAGATVASAAIAQARRFVFLPRTRTRRGPAARWCAIESGLPMDNDAFWPGTKILRGHPRDGSAPEAGPAGDAGSSAAMAIDVLNRMLPIARTAARRHEQQYLVSLRDHSPLLASAALEHAHGARLHADRISARITALGGAPEEAAPDRPAPALFSELLDGRSRLAVIDGLLTAERAAVAGYRAIASSALPLDPATREVLDAVVSGAEERAARLGRLLEAGPTSRGADLRANVPRFGVGKSAAGRGGG